MRFELLLKTTIDDLPRATGVYMNDRLDESIHRCSYIFPAPEYIAKRRSPGEIQKRARNHSFFTGRIHDLPSSSSSLTAVRFESPPCPHGPIDTGTCTSSGQSHLLCRPPKRLHGTHIWPYSKEEVFFFYDTALCMPTPTLTRVIVQTLARRRVSTQHRYPWNRVELIQSLLTHCSRTTYT